MAKKQTAVTEEEAIANAKAYFEQLELKKKGLQQSAKANPSTNTKTSASKARGRDLPPRSPAVQRRQENDEAKLKGQALYQEMMQKEQMKRDRMKKSTTETCTTTASSRTSARVAPSVASVPGSPASRLTAQERRSLQQFYQTMQKKEDEKKQDKCHATATPSSSVPTRNDARRNVPKTVFCCAFHSTPRSQPTLDTEEASRVQQFYETLIAQEEQKRGSSAESVASSCVDDEPSFVRMNTKGHPSVRYQEPKVSKCPENTTPYESRQRVIDGLAIFVACFLVQNLSAAFPSLLGTLFFYSFQHMSQMAVTFGSIALKALFVSFMALGLFLFGRSICKNVFKAASGDASEQFYQDIESVKVLVYHELMTQPDVGVTEASLRDMILSRRMGDMMRDQRTARPWSEREKNYWNESVWSEAVTQLKQEPRILKIKVRVEHGIETIWSWSDMPSNGTRSKKRKVH